MLREAVPGENGGLEAQRLSARGTVARWEGPGRGRALLTPLVGRSQAAALGQALAWMRELGFDAAPLASASASLAGLPGWMEPVTMGQGWTRSAPSEMARWSSQAPCRPTNRPTAS